MLLNGYRGLFNFFCSMIIISNFKVVDNFYCMQTVMCLWTLLTKLKLMDMYCFISSTSTNHPINKYCFILLTGIQSHWSTSNTWHWQLFHKLHQSCTENLKHFVQRSKTCRRGTDQNCEVLSKSASSSSSESQARVFYF